MLSFVFLVSIFAISNANSDSSLCIDACEYLRGKHCEQLCADNSGTTEIIKTTGTIRTTEKTETTTASPTTRNRDKDYRGCVTVCTSYGGLDCENKCRKLIYGYDSTAVPTPNETTTPKSINTHKPVTEGTTTTRNKDKDYSKCVTVCTTYGELDCEKKCKKLIYGYASTAAPTPKETTTTESITTHKPITDETATTRTTESVTSNVPVTEETTTTTSAHSQCLKNCSIFFFKNWCEDLCSL